MEKKKITITKVLAPVTLDHSTVFKCMAEVPYEHDGKEVIKEIELATYEPDFGNKFEVGLKCEAEINDKPSKDGKFMNHYINQIWIDGEAVKQKKQWKSGDSPEARASIEAQVAAKLITELIIHDKANPLQIKRLNAWIEKALPLPGDKPIQIEKPVSTNAEKPIEGDDKASKFLEEMKKCRTQGQVLMLCNSTFKLNKTQVMDILKKSDITDLSQIRAEDVARIILAEMEVK